MVFCKGHFTNFYKLNSHALSPLKIAFVPNYFIWSSFWGLTLLSCFLPLSAAPASLWALINFPLWKRSAGRRPSSWSLAMCGQDRISWCCFTPMLSWELVNPVNRLCNQQPAEQTWPWPSGPGFVWHHQGKPETTPAELGRELQNLSYTGWNSWMRDDARFPLKYCWF